MTDEVLQWEYVTRTWSFVGPEYDDWPDRDRYSALLATQKEARKQARSSQSALLGLIALEGGREERVEGDEGTMLRERYRAWRQTVEAELLNEFGEAGFELVSVSRHETEGHIHGGSMYWYSEPVIHVFCYFKRPHVLDAPEPPQRQIGFRTT